MNLPTRFDFREVEPRIYHLWMDRECFESDFDPDGEPRAEDVVLRPRFVIAIPPPNVTGRLHMDGRAIYSFMLSRVPQQVEACLKLNGLALDDIDRFVFHQANRYMLESLRDRMKLPPGKVAIAVADGGNTVGSTLPIVLESLLAERPQRVLISGFGVGLSWGTNVLQANRR